MQYNTILKQYREYFKAKKSFIFSKSLVYWSNSYVFRKCKKKKKKFQRTCLTVMTTEPIMVWLTKKKRYLKQKPHLLKFLYLSSNLWKKNNIISNACNELSFFFKNNISTTKLIYYLCIFTPFPPSLVENSSWAKLLKAGLR